MGARFKKPGRTTRTCWENEHYRQKNVRVYIVGNSGPEHNSIKSIHKTYAGASRAWNKLRLELLQEAKKYLKEYHDTMCCDMYSRMIKNLSCRDPTKIDNYPHETPYIIEQVVKE